MVATPVLARHPLTTLPKPILWLKPLTPLFSISKLSYFPCGFTVDLPIETQLRGGWLDHLGLRDLLSGTGGRGG